MWQSRSWAGFWHDIWSSTLSTKQNRDQECRCADKSQLVFLPTAAIELLLWGCVCCNFWALQCYLRHSTWSATPRCMICCWKMDGKRARGLYLQPEADATMKCRTAWALKNMHRVFCACIPPNITFGSRTIKFQEFGFRGLQHFVFRSVPA